MGGAQETAEPFSWTVVGEEEAPPGGWQVGLWLPRRAGPRVLLGDVLGRHAAAYPVSAGGEARCVVSLDLLFKDPARVPTLGWERATLTPEGPGGGEPLAPLESGEAWRGEPVGARRSEPDRPGQYGLLRVRLAFPLPPAGCQRLTLSVPVLDELPLVRRFARWEALVAAAGADLEAWRAAAEADQSQPGASERVEAARRAFRAHGELVRAALLLRELERGQAGEPALAPGAVLRALAETAGGRQQHVPDHGDAAAAARVLRRWGELGHPRLPGIAPPQRPGRRGER